MSAHVCGCDPEEHDHHCEHYPNCVWGRIERPHTFAVQDSGVSQQSETGVVRDITNHKIDYSLAVDGPMFRRYAEHLTKGAKNFNRGKRNWMKANSQEDVDRFRESAFRHFLQWYFGDTDEDHASAVFFNINGAEYVKARMTK